MKFYLVMDFVTDVHRKDGSRPPDTATRTPSSSNHTTPYNTLSRPMSGQGYDDNTLTPARGGGGLRPSQHQPAQQQFQPQRSFHPQDHQGYHPQDLRASDLDGYRVMSRSNASLNNSRGNLDQLLVYFELSEILCSFHF